MTTRTFSAILAERARADPDEPVVIDSVGTMTAGELNAAASALAHELVDRGVRRDDLVAVSLPNGRDFVVACFGIWRAGATPQPLSTDLTASERGALEDIAVPALAIGGRPASPDVEWLPDVRVAPRAGVLPDIAASCWKAPATSGSTGRPKIVRAAAGGTIDPSRPVAAFLPRAATQIVAGPLWHSAVFTYAFRGMLTGHRLIILDRFDPERWLDAVETHCATWGLLVPAMMARLLRLPDEVRAPERVASIESVLHMGAPCAPALKRAFLDWIGAERVDEVYAGSESNGLTRITGTEWLERPGSVGRPIGGTEIRIRDDDGRDLPAGASGLVWMRRGETAAYAYMGATSRRDDAGWDTLGDIGHLDDDGYLFLHDRADDVINRGGDKIAPALIEAVLEEHPAVAEAVAFGVGDDDLGQVAHAVVFLVDADADMGAVAAHVRELLGARAPAALHVSETPLRNDAGKVRRSALAERFRDTAHSP
ncbi:MULTISPECIES: AMP-binding protein [Microbacterium]|uniref:AMP-binding protein n=1 Tax=Microbacterium TaxID=33882 RepID=UPI002780FDE8|nr:MULTISPECIES: AMP-binding protein [Microbacterium]MDQ1082697.1 bile acid-coenzyme A ligase [Microbacterium sp. SORGH_AS_0344]MDQ1168533.1 bile acid-coenzyme A ligase [Microbacterium proteolyticum]